MALLATRGIGLMNPEDHAGLQTVATSGFGSCDRLFAHHGVQHRLRATATGILGPLDEQRWGPGGEPRVPRSGSR